MPNILLYCEIERDHVLPETGEIVTLAAKLKKETGSNVILSFVSNEANKYIPQLQFEGVDKIIGIMLEDECSYDTALYSKAFIECVKKVEPELIIGLASSMTKSVLSRTAMALRIGMTADCTDVLFENGKYVQYKPSYGANSLVKCSIKGEIGIVTVIKGSYDMAPIGTFETKYEEIDFDKKSKLINLIEEQFSDAGQFDFMDILVCAGRGAVESGTLEKIKAFADNIGASFGGTRPLADSGIISFDNQIGQTGKVVRPKLCICFGISGAIQFTEGLKGNPIIWAINNNPEAAIFKVAEYGIIANIEDLDDDFWKM